MKTDIEYAALTMGGEQILDRLDCGISVTDSDGRHRSLPHFNPLHDDGDSRRLEIACLNWIGRVIECPKPASLAYAEFAGFLCGIDITPEQYRAAVFALAVAIGRVIEGNDNAG
jgi:hypothetical protein